MDLQEARRLLNDILMEWDHFLTRLQNIKEEELEDDLFTQIDFLSQLEEARAVIADQLFQLEQYLNDINSRQKSEADSEQANQLQFFQADTQLALEHIKPKLEIAEEAYEDVAEEVLSRCQDRIQELVDTILEHKQRAVSLKNRIGLELEEEDQLRELRDSLETYREIRLENLEEEAGDPIIDQLNSQMVACDSALLIDESSL